MKRHGGFLYSLPREKFYDSFEIENLGVLNFLEYISQHPKLRHPYLNRLGDSIKIISKKNVRIPTYVFCTANSHNCL